MKLLLDMLYPRRCIGCGAASPDSFHYICRECWADSARVAPPFCSHCGDPVAGAVDHDFICYSCSAKKPAFDGARSAARYDGVVGEALRQLKYEQALWLAPDLATLLHHCIRAEYPGQAFDLLVPVPLHHVRKRSRGYNQSEVLAKELGRKLGHTSHPKLLQRIRPTISQTNLTAKDRLSNVTQAFRYGKGKRLAGKKVLLVDDVMTTGATVNACAKTLKKGGAASVHVITAARG
jgi:ComF family protein